MKKLICAAAFVLLCALFVMPVSAAEKFTSPIYIDTLNGIDEYTSPDNSISYTIDEESKTATLTLNGADIEVVPTEIGQNLDCILINLPGYDVDIIIKGENRIVAGTFEYEYTYEEDGVEKTAKDTEPVDGIETRGCDVTISGNGTLDIVGTCCGICVCEDHYDSETEYYYDNDGFVCDLIIDGAKINSTAHNDFDNATDAIGSSGKLIVKNNAELVLSADSYGLYTELDIEISDSDITVEYAGYDGICSYKGDVNIEDSSITVEEAVYDGIDAEKEIRITDSDIVIKSAGWDALFSNEGDITVDNSKITVDYTAEDGLDTESGITVQNNSYIYIKHAVDNGIEADGDIMIDSSKAVFDHTEDEPIYAADGNVGIYNSVIKIDIAESEGIEADGSDFYDDDGNIDEEKTIEEAPGCIFIDNSTITMNGVYGSAFELGSGYMEATNSTINVKYAADSAFRLKNNPYKPVSIDDEADDSDYEPYYRSVYVKLENCEGTINCSGKAIDTVDTDNPEIITKDCNFEINEGVEEPTGTADPTVRSRIVDAIIEMLKDLMADNAG